jgi:hypothetical protein
VTRVKILEFCVVTPCSLRPYSHGTTQKKLKGYASHQTVAWETPPMQFNGSPPVAPSENRH